MPRGKKNKLKKIQAKYADQDEEEKEMRLALLGAKEVKGGFKPKEKNKFTDKEATETENQDSEGSESSEEEQTEANEKVEEAEDIEETKEEVDDLVIPENENEDVDEELDVGLLEDQKDADDENENDEEEEVQTQNQDNHDEDDISIVPESQDISEIDKLTGLPHRKDLIHFCVPMLAPYITIQQNKYKVKITPGTMKRGRV